MVDYQLGLLDGGVVAAQIKKVKPRLPVVMLAGNIELPDDALKYVDVLVAKSEGPRSLLATVRSVLSVKPPRRAVAKPTDEKDAPFSPEFGEASVTERSDSDEQTEKLRRNKSGLRQRTHFPLKGRTPIAPVTRWVKDYN